MTQLAISAIFCDMARGRPPITEAVLGQRIADYCARYGVSGRNADGLPPYPAGRRETRQHREWVVLYKALGRLRARAWADDPLERETLARSQSGRCPICDQKVDAAAVLDHDRVTGRVRGLVHGDCARFLRLAEAAGPETLARAGSYLWPGRARSAQKVP